MSSNQLYNLAVTRLALGDFAECERILESVVRRKRMGRAYANLAYCQREQGKARYEDALANYAQARRARPDDPIALLGEAILVERAGDAARLEVLKAKLETLDPAALAALEGAAPRPSPGRLPPDVHPEIAAPRQAPRGIMGD